MKIGKSQLSFVADNFSSFRNVSKISRLRIIYFGFYSTNNVVEFLILEEL